MSQDARDHKRPRSILFGYTRFHLAVLLGLFGLITTRAHLANASSPTYTMADLHLYVDARWGRDSNDCETEATACPTIQEAVDKVPKLLRHIVTISVASGNYAGFVLEGFQVNPSFRAGGLGAGLIIQGHTKRLATGTTTKPCNGGGYRPAEVRAPQQLIFDTNVHSTLTDSTQTWIPNDSKLRGRKLCLTSGVAEGECLAIEDNTAHEITLAGYWSDFHYGWFPDRNTPPTPYVVKGVNQYYDGCDIGDAYAITEPDTHLDKAVTLPQGIGGLANGQAKIDPIAAIIVSNVRGGASAGALYAQPADNFEVLISDFDVSRDDPDGHPVRSVAFVDSSDHIGFKYFTTGLHAIPTKWTGLYAGAGLFVFRNSNAWTVQSSYANGTWDPSASSPMIACSRSATADTLVGVFGNVVDDMPAYFGDENVDGTTCHSSVMFGGESIRHTGGNFTLPPDPNSPGKVLGCEGSGSPVAAITFQSAALVHFVGTKINGSRQCPSSYTLLTPMILAACVKLGDVSDLGFGRAYFEGGDFSKCSGSGIKIAGDWMVAFIEPTTSAEGPNGQNRGNAIEATNGAKVYGLYCASNSAPTPPPTPTPGPPPTPVPPARNPCANGGANKLRATDNDLAFDNVGTSFSYDQVLQAAGATITDPQRGGLFTYYNGEGASSTSVVPPTWVSYGHGVVYGFTSPPGDLYRAKPSDHVIAMSSQGPGARVIQIPGKSPAGTDYIIIDSSPIKSAGNSITVMPCVLVQNTGACSPDSGLINGAASVVIPGGVDTVIELVSDGMNYWIVSLR